MLKEKDDGYIYLEMNRSHWFRPDSIIQCRITIDDNKFIFEEKNGEGEYDVFSDQSIKESGFNRLKKFIELKRSERDLIDDYRIVLSREESLTTDIDWIDIEKDIIYYCHKDDNMIVDDEFIRKLIKIYKRGTRKQAVLAKLEG
jgi:hypothetical protein